ncbi:MAG: membrane dipeptidase [Pseudomonadota bacterium]
MRSLQPVFDGHNDALLKLSMAESDPVDLFRDGGPGHVDVPKARAGGMIGGFFALYSPTPNLPLDFAIFDSPPYDIPLPPPLSRAEADPPVQAQAAIAGQLEAAGLLRFMRSAADVDAGFDAAMGGGPMAAVLHLEGAECIGPDGEGLDALYEAGLRSLGPVWSRPTVFAHGVPFRFPSDGDTGPGLTAEGRALVRACVARDMVVDCSHMTLKGFFDVAEEGAALVATHSNACAISNGARNLTDDQLRAIGQTGGMVGLNYATMFLRPDGGRDPAGALDHAVPHLAHMIDMAGENHVGLGSDFDGAPMPEGLESAVDLPTLVGLMRDAGFGDALIEKLCAGNWRAFLKRTLGG